MKYKLRIKIIRKNKQIYKLPKCNFSEIDDIFAEMHTPLHISSSIISFIGKGDEMVEICDTSSWVLSVLSKKSFNIFEFGTYRGKTTYLMAKNSSKDTKIITITLPKNQIDTYKFEEGDNPKETENAINESLYESFSYISNLEEKKIEQIYQDSKLFDESKYLDYFDLVFIDGSHTYSYVSSDTEKSLKMIKKGGIIIWNNYIEDSDVFKYLNHIKKEKNINLKQIPNTALVFYKH